MRILANPALLRALVVLFSAVIAFVIGLAFIRFLRQQIAQESDVSDETPKSLDALPMHLYNTVIQQLKQQKQEILVQSQSEQQRAKASEALHQAVLADLPCGVLIFGPNGLVIAQNDDDGSGGTNSRIPLGGGLLTLPSSSVGTPLAKRLEILNPRSA